MFISLGGRMVLRRALISATAAAAFTAALFILLQQTGARLLGQQTYAQAVRSQGEPPMKFPVTKTDAEWKKLLTPEQYEVTRKGGTECAFRGAYWDFHGQGEFVCVCCGNPI